MRMYVSLFLCFWMFLSSCSATQSSLPRWSNMLREATDQNGRACVRSMDINGYGTLKNNIVSIDGRRKYYLATLLPACRSINTSVGALFSGDFGEVCGGDKIVTNDEVCRINQLFEFDSREQAFEVYRGLVAKRKEMREELENAN